MTKEHVSAKNACGRRWPDQTGLWHLCRVHVLATGACRCPCGESSAPNRALLARIDGAQ